MSPASMRRSSSSSKASDAAVGATPAQSGAEQHQRGHPVRVRRRHLQGHPATERGADERSGLDALVVEERDHLGDVREGPGREGSVAVPGEVRGEDAVPLGEDRELRRPHPAVGDAGVEEDDRRTGPGSVER